MTILQQQYDFIIVGGGSAGSIVAAELAKRSSCQVLLLEAGPAAEENPDTLSADGFKYCFANDNVMRDRFSEPQAGLNGRATYQGTGWTMGGSGSVNGMVFTPGDKGDFEAWPADWQWPTLAPFFDRLAQKLQPQARSATGFTSAAISAAKQLGFQHKDMMTDGELKGFIGHNAMNYQANTRRSSYVAFLQDQQPSNLDIINKALVHKVLIENNTAVGIEFELNNQRHCIRASKEIVLSAGALETPKLLMLSGVGPASVLAEFGIEEKLHAPAIGQNLQDHPNVCIFYRGKQAIDFGYPQLYGFDRVNPHSCLAPHKADTCFAFFAAPITLKQSMYRMLPTMVLPRWLYRFKALRKTVRALVDLLFLIPGANKFVNSIYGIVVILGKPESRGYLSLASNDARDQAVINPAYYQNPNDLHTMIAGIKVAQDMAAQQSLQAWGATRLARGARTQQFAALKRWIADATMTTFHFCGSCSMGDSSDAPVDPRLKLRGIEGLRIADASVMPEVPVSALNAPSMMIALRAAEFILNDHQLESATGSDMSIKTEEVA
ncbi:MAG: GMC family oxidoreductase [Pseudomonadales bacterium]|nr:GMC family oxidoreductase [Pseudomonadales bacterium]